MKTVTEIKNVNEYSHFEIKEDEVCFIDKNNRLNIIDVSTFNIKYIIPLAKCFYYETDHIYIYIHGRTWNTSS
jgi:hypothetical protein